MSRSRERATCALAALALLASPAVAEAGFTEAAPIAGGDALVDLAVGPDGTTAALWTSGDDLVAGVKPLGGEWAVEALGAGERGAIAVRPDGGVVAAYYDVDHAELFAHVRPPGGPFGPGEDLDGIDAPIDLAVRSSGAALVAWRDGTNVVVKERTAAWSADLAATAALSPATEAPVLAAGPGERASVVYADPAVDQVVVATGPAFADQDVLAGEPVALGAAYRADGQLDVTWRAADTTVTTAKIDAGGSPASTDIGSGTAGPAVARGVAAWSLAGQVHAGRATGTGMLSDTLGVLAGGATGAPLAGALGAGRALVAWPTGGELEYRVVNGATVAGVAPFELGAATPMLATDPAATVGAVAWAGDGQIHAAAYDDGPPVVSALAVPARVTAGAPFGIGVTVADAESGAPDVRWDLGDGRTVTGPNPPAISYPTPGPRLVTVTATDAGGNTASASATIDVQSPPPPPGVFGFDVSRDRQAPLLGRLKLTHKTFRIDGGQTAMSAQKRARPVDRGTQVLWTLDEPATVFIGVEKLGAGWRSSGGVCALRRRTSSAKKCTRLVVMGQLTRRGKTGRNGMRFTGRFGRHALSPGKYRFAVFARDAAGNTSPVKRLSFTMRE